MKRSRFYAPQVVHHQFFPSTPASHVKIALAPPLARALANLGVNDLYAHQGAAIEKIRQGRNVVVATPTASGKTLIYNLPVVETLLRDPRAKALYIFPLKALEQDQLKTFQEWTAAFRGEVQFPAAIYDGDTSSYRRQKIRENIPPVLITNPDMVHLSLLAFHPQWEVF
ncbi:MAG: DEAD/DEAH box helicase, partial [Deltaproteobacteria bacterium]|nr:DEAD/DEAH box helicase [Deltaproteobacteria bacterium]